MGYFEVRWPYYLGFGALVEALYESLPFFVGAGVTAMYFSIVSIIVVQLHNFLLILVMLI